MKRPLRLRPARRHNRAPLEAIPPDPPSFPERVRAGAYEGTDPGLKFRNDAKVYAEGMGVPRQYSFKVVDFAWDIGHDYGLYQVLAYLEDMIRVIFKEDE